MATAEPNAHVRVDGTTYSDGIYRVVGASEERITLLKVGTVDGRRVHTGLVVDLRPDQVAQLPDAPNPDGNRPVHERLTRLTESVYWGTRTFVRTVFAHPLPATGAGGVLLLGLVGPLPEAVADLLVLGGAIGLAAVGSGLVPHR